jgi:hypothetical protein
MGSFFSHRETHYDVSSDRFPEGHITNFPYPVYEKKVLTLSKVRKKKFFLLGSLCKSLSKEDLIVQYPADF